MRIIIFLASLWILSWVLKHNIKRSNRFTSERKESFLERESRANATRRADIEHLDYLQIPIETLPFGVASADSENHSRITEYENKIKSLSSSKILNLNGFTNTDLKEAYGPANLPTLSDCDARFTELIRTLNLWAKALIESSPESAVIILEYAISIGSDITDTYTMLASYHKKQNNIQKINDLTETASALLSANKNRIIHKLNHIKSSS